MMNFLKLVRLGCTYSDHFWSLMKCKVKFQHVCGNDSKHRSKRKERNCSRRLEKSKSKQKNAC